jgi:N-acyl-D-amino-acid deacylase
MINDFDLIIKDGHIIDGTGNPYYRGDIGISDGKIKLIAQDIPIGAAKQVVLAKQMVVSPGFIDVHTHDDLFVLRKPAADEKILQGITTLILGNCGFSPAPLSQNGEATIRSFSGILGGEGVIDRFKDVSSFNDYLNMLETARLGINVGTLVGNVTLRIAVMDHDMRPPTDSEMEQMKDLVAEAMQSGALGLSSGLIYAPGSYASTEELTELARVVHTYGGLYTTHMRSESSHVMESIHEAIQIGEQSEARVEISHFKVSGKKNWGRSDQAIDLVRQARARGLEITADQYPYNAGSTGLFALLPPDVLSDGLDALSANLREATYRKKLRERLQPESSQNSGGMLNEADYEGILIASCHSHPDYEGQSLARIAKGKQQHPLEIVFDLVAEEKMAVTMVIFNMSEDDIEKIMSSEFVMMGSDGLPASGARIHPRMTGTAPRILGRYVRERKVLSLEDAVRKMTSLPAQTFRLKEKGLLKPGFDADITIFDPDTILDRSTYEHPGLAPDGIHYVIVNGEIAVQPGGKIMEAHSGKVLRHSG